MQNKEFQAMACVALFQNFQECCVQMLQKLFFKCRRWNHSKQFGIWKEPQNSLVLPKVQKRVYFGRVQFFYSLNVWASKQSKAK